MITKQAMKVNIAWDNLPTFSLIPLNQDVFFIEAAFEPRTKVLNIITKVKYEGFTMIPKLNTKGQLIPIPGKNSKQDSYEQERRNIEKFYELKIIKRSEIEEFCQLFAGTTVEELDPYFAPLEAPAAPPQENKESNEKASLKILDKEGN
jgi:hypothetical protein